MPNHLIDSSSPYLLQHANNPVDWYPWGDEALQRAKDEDKPIFLSIGYAACHWCHVMAHESFEDAHTAAFMNEHFINIKVDREERPDLDTIYMQATTAMTDAGGWPMSVFLTPDLQPFYAGTYFPPIERYNMPSFKGLLAGIERAWREQRDEISRVGAQVTRHIKVSTATTEDQQSLTTGHLEAIASALVENYDWGYGGWGAAPKFPQPMTIEFLLGRAALLPGKNPRELEAALHTLKAMARGGMYDVVGGGFARYSTDNFWRVPHFEKMLYDNAQLARAYLHAFQLTGEQFFRRVVDETLSFVTRELLHPDGGFFSSLDADSEGEEGKFYVWRLDEVKEILGEETGFFTSAYGLTAKGNWEGINVLQRALDDPSLASHFAMPLEQVPARLFASHEKLLRARQARIRPGTDDKVLTSWNGLMLAAYAESARVLNDSSYLDMAVRNADFLLTSLRDESGLRRSWRDGLRTPEVFLEDYASLILGLLELYQADFDVRWFIAASELAEEMVSRFNDPDLGGFFDTPSTAGNLLLRPKDLQDNATPSGNALACEALLKLSAFSDKGNYRDLAERQLAMISRQVLQYPTAYSRWLSAAAFALGSVKQVALVGKSGDATFTRMLDVIHTLYRPSTVVAASEPILPPGSPSLLADRHQLKNSTTAYVCEGFVCRLPVTTPEALQEQLNSE